MRLEILPFSTTTKYLGRLIGFDRPHEAEVDNRIRIAWKRFMAHKEELTCKSYTLRNRLRLFDSVVTSCVLYGAACWTLTQALQVKLQRTQRKMLRMILGSGRRRKESAHTSTEDYNDASDGEASSGTCSASSTHMEPWTEWLQRTTRAAEAQLQKYRIDDWIMGWKRKVWRWAGRVASLAPDRWARKAMLWQPETLAHAKGRSQAHPRKRWTDDIVKFLQSQGTDVTLDSWHRHTTNWNILENKFC